MFKIRMTHIEPEDELHLLMNFDEIKRGADLDTPKVSVEELLSVRAWMGNGVQIDDAIKKCLVSFAEETRQHPIALQGVSTRSLVLAMPALQAWALVQGRDYVAPSDVADLAHHIFAHRLMMSAGSDSLEVVKESLKNPMDVCARGLL